MICFNCQLKIDDMRKETRCTSCNTPLHKACAIKDNNKYFCDVCYTESTSTSEEIIIPDVIRRTYIQTYKDCPYKYYGEVVKGFTQPPNIYTQVGIDLHTLFHKACLDENFNKDNMLYEFGKLWDNCCKLTDDEELKQRMYKRSLKSINTFYDILPNLGKAYKLEDTVTFEVGEGLPKVEATLDRIDIVKDELELIDWKTGVVMVGMKLSNDMQAPLYIYGARQNYKRPVRKFTYYYLEDNKTRIFERIDNDNYVCRVGKREYFINITNAIKEVQQIFSRIKQGDFNIPRNTKRMYFTCKMCHLREIEFCKGADIEVWRQYNKT